MKPYELDEQHRLIHNGDSYVIQRRIASKKTSLKAIERWRAKGYYTSIQSVLKAFVDVQISKSQDDLVSALQHAVTRVDTIASELTRPVLRALQKVKHEPVAESESHSPKPKRPAKSVGISSPYDLADRNGR